MLTNKVTTWNLNITTHYQTQKNSGIHNPTRLHQTQGHYRMQSSTRHHQPQVHYRIHNSARHHNTEEHYGTQNVTRPHQTKEHSSNYTQADNRAFRNRKYHHTSSAQMGIWESKSQLRISRTRHFLEFKTHQDIINHKDIRELKSQSYIVKKGAF